MGANWDQQQKQLSKGLWDTIRHDIGRKCSEWEQCHDEQWLHLTLEEAGQLNEYVVPHGTGPFNELPEIFADSIFIANVDGRKYLVNTEGHSYCRYIAVLEMGE